MIEVEVKALVNTAQRDYLLQKLNFGQPSGQLNHYFKVTDSTDLKGLFEVIGKNQSAFIKSDLAESLNKGKKLSIRTRECSTGELYFIVKYSLNDGTSENGNVRKEIEIELSAYYNYIFDLDSVLLEYGLEVLSKWSRERREAKFVLYNRTYNITLDLNAGYGYLCECEVETLIPELDSDIAEDWGNFIRSFVLKELGLFELDPALLDEMFNEYNANWREYYGTSKTLWENDEFVNRLKAKGLI